MTSKRFLYERRQRFSTAPRNSNLVPAHLKELERDLLVRIRRLFDGTQIPSLHGSGIGCQPKLRHEEIDNHLDRREPTPIANKRMALLPCACGEKKPVTSSSKKVKPVAPSRCA